MNVIRTALFATLVVFGQSTRIAIVPSGSYLGVMVREIDGERAKALKLTEEAGVEITRVESDSPADKAGLKPGDVVLQYNGQRVEGMEQFSRMVRETPAGRDVKLSIFREGATQTVAGKVGARRAPAGFSTAIAPPAPDFHLPDIPRSFMSWRSSTLGLEAESLDGQLAQYFGVKDGVLVRSVVKGSAAEKAGIRSGDVITRVGDTKVATPADISGQIRSLRGKPMAVVLMRDHREMTVTVTVGDDRAEKLWEPGWGMRTIQLIDLRL